MPIETGAAGAGGSGSGGGGGGDASAANQVLGLTALDQIYDALVLVGTEATSADNLAAVNSLGDGATLADLATALAPLATEATQQDVLAALEAQGIDAAAVKAGVDLLVPDLDAVRVATEATAAATGTTADTDTSNTLVGLLKWIKARLPTALTSNGGLKTGLVEPIPTGSNTIGAVTGSGNFSSTNAVGSQSDGHSATIGTTTDAATATTVIGRLQKLVSLLPAALGGGGGLKSEGVGVAGTPAGGVVSVQGVAGGTAVPISGTVTTSAPANTTATGNLTALNDVVSIVAGTGNAIGIQLTGTWAGVVAFEVSGDGGTTWTAASVTTNSFTTMVSSATANGLWSIESGAVTHFRTRRSVATSGTAVATLVLTNGQRSMAGFPVVTQNPTAANWSISTNEIPTFGAMLMVSNQSGGANMVKGDTAGVPCFQGRNPENNTSYGNPVAIGFKNGSGQSRVPLCDSADRTVVSGASASGSAVAGNPVLMAGSDGTNARTLATNTSGQLVMVGAGTSGSPTGGVASVQGTITSSPATNAAALPTREVPAYAAGRQYHAQTSAGVANAASKLLFGFTNTTGGNVFVDRIHVSNMQTGTIAGVIGQLNVQTGSSAIAGGTTIDGVSSPSLVASYHDPSVADPSGLTWNTNGTLGGTVKTIESCQWSTDELSANGTGLANEIAALGAYHDVFDFGDDPIVLPNGYSIAVVCDSALTNGSTLVDFNLHQ